MTSKAKLQQQIDELRAEIEGMKVKIVALQASQWSFPTYPGYPVNPPSFPITPTWDVPYATGDLVQPYCSSVTII